MKKMLLLILIIGLTVCGYLVNRRAQPVAPPRAKAPTAEPAVVNTWQENFTLDLRTDYTGSDPAQRKLIETLREEAARQRPQEGRN